MEVKEYTPTPERMKRTDLSHNGADLKCAKPRTALRERCTGQARVLYLRGGFLWPAYENHRDEIRGILSLIPEKFWGGRKG